MRGNDVSRRKAQPVKSVNRITRFFWHSLVVGYRDVLGQSPHLANLVPRVFPSKGGPAPPIFWGKSPGEEVAHLASLRTYIQWSSHFLKTAARAPVGGFFSLVTCTRLATRKFMVTAVLMMDSKVARLVLFCCCCCCCCFHGQYLPSLNTSCLATNKDMEKRLPQLYYTKMKNCCNQCYMLTSAPAHDCGKNSRCREIPLQGK